MAKLERIASSKITLILILLICLGLRFGLAFYKGNLEITDNDARVYLNIADHLANGRGFSTGQFSFEAKPTAYSEPGYPFFLAILYRTVAGGLQDISFAQSVLDTITCLLVFQLTLIATKRHYLAAALAALAYAVYPPLILASCTPMTETLETFVFTAAVLLLVSGMNKSLWRVVLAGVVMGAAILVRSPMTLFPVAVAVVFYLTRRENKLWLKNAVVYAGIAWLMLVPWIIRSSIAMHSLILTPTRAGMALWGGTGPADGYTLGAWSYPVDSVKRNLYDHPRIPDISDETYVKITAFQARLRQMNEVECDRALKRAAMQEIREHPTRYAFLGIKKFFRLWFNIWHDWPASSETKALAVLNLLIYGLAVLGYKRSRLSQEFRWTALASCVYVTLIAVVTYSVVRFSYPVMPLVLILAASGVARLLSPKEVAQPAPTAETPVSA